MASKNIWVVGTQCNMQIVCHRDKCTLETYIILLINVTPINLIKKKRKEIKGMRTKIEIKFGRIKKGVNICLLRITEIKSWFFVFVFLMNVQSWSLRKSY